MKIFDHIKNKTGKYKIIKGFAMVEALVAITILVASIIGPLTLAIQSAKYSRLALQRVQASYLADEGIELLVNYRKSLTQFCNYNQTLIASGGHCDIDIGANKTAESESFYSFKSEMENASPSCYRYSPSDTNYCRVDKKNFNYHAGDITQFPTFINDLPTEDKLYQVDGDIMSYMSRAVTGATPTIYTRVFYVEAVDTPTFRYPYDSELPKVLSLKIVSIACFGETTCTLASKNKVVVEQYVTR